MRDMGQEQQQVRDSSRKRKGEAHPEEQALHPSPAVLVARVTAQKPSRVGTAGPPQTWLPISS